MPRSSVSRTCSLSVLCLLLCAALSPVAASGPPHGFVVAGENGVATLVRNPEDGSYEKTGFHGLSKVIGLARCGDDIAVATLTAVVKLNRDLEKTAATTFKSVGSLAADESHVYVSGNDAFYVLNQELRPEGIVSLEREGIRKNAHDILIHNKRAYLLDNIMMPILLFRVDISDPSAPNIIDHIRFNLINGHLDMQWLNPELGQWCVVVSESSMTHWDRSLYIYPKDKGTDPLSIRSLVRVMKRVGKKEPVIQFDGVTRLAPAWAVITEDDTPKICQVRTTGNELTFSPKRIAFGAENMAGGFIVKEEGNFLIVAPKRGYDFWVYALKPALQRIGRIDVEGMGVGGIVDVFVTEGTR